MREPENDAFGNNRGWSQKLLKKQFLRHKRLAFGYETALKSNEK